MINRLPADVPKSGERYDLTLTGAGLDSRKRELAMFVIDNGDHRGVRVSAFLTPILKTALIESGVEAENFSTSALDAQKYDIRLSAQIVVERLMKSSHGTYATVDEEYNASNVYCVYHLSDYGDPENNTELAKAFERKENKFNRKTAVADAEARQAAAAEAEEDSPSEEPAEEAPVQETKPKAESTRKKSSAKKPATSKTSKAKPDETASDGSA